MEEKDIQIKIKEILAKYNSGKSLTTADGLFLNEHYHRSMNVRQAVSKMLKEDDLPNDSINILNIIDRTLPVKTPTGRVFKMKF